jgi:hypothetical protein
MAYIINRFDGTQLTIVDDGVLDTSTPVGLLGRNYTGYGEIQNENFIFLLENFANASPPARALSGQAWYDKGAKALKVYNGTTWLSIGNATVAETEPAHSNGGLWLKTTTQQLYVSDGTVWRQVGPEAADGFSVTKMTSTIIKDNLGANKPAILSQINGEITAIIVNEDFTINAATEIPGFSQLNRGINLKSSNYFSGALKGNADSATRLDGSRTINSVEFNGASNITITATTNQPLKAGDFIIGSEFNGAVETTWDINASSENLIGTVVSRNSVGGFSATIVNADLFGNVQGNVTAVTGTSTFNEIVVNNITGETFSGLAARVTRLATPRLINTVPFDGTENITLPVSAETLTGNTLAPNVVDSALTSLGKLIALEVEAPGIIVGDGNNLNIKIEGFTPTLESDVSNAIKLKLLTGSVTIAPTTITFVSANAANADGVLSPAFVPDYTLSTPANQRPVLGLPSHRWRDIYSAAATLDVLKATTLSGRTVADEVTVSNKLIVNNGTYSALFGNVTGNLTGSVTGAASLNLLKAGDSMSGDLSWTTTGRGLSWSINTDTASIRYYNSLDGSTDNRLEFNTGDNSDEYFRWTHSPASGSLYESMRLTPNSSGLANLRVTGQITVVGGGVSAVTYTGDGSQLTNLNVSNFTTGIFSADRLAGTYNISIVGNVAGNVTGNLQGVVTGSLIGNVTGASSLNVLKAGDTLSGDLNWSTTGRGLTWGMNTDGASIRFYNTGDGDAASRLEFQTTDNGNEYFSWTHASGSTFESMRLVPNSSGNAALTVFGNATINGTTTGTFSGVGTSLTINAGNLTTGTVPRDRLTGEYSISITGSANTAVRASVANIVDGITTAQIVSALGYVPSDTGLAATGIVGVSATISGPITSTSTSTGALVVAGGAGFGLDVTVGGSVTADDGFIGNLLTTGSAGVAGTVTGNWTLSAGSRLQATYADLAELYTSDESYEAGTVLIFGGDAETTTTMIYGDTRLAGVVSTNPAHLLNSNLTGTVSAIALVGRIPCKIIGQIKKGDMLTTSSIPGYATKMIEFIPGAFIGKALHDKETSGEGIVEISLNRA